MTEAEKRLYQEIQSNADGFDEYFSDEADESPIITEKATPGAGRGAQLRKQRGNPTFSAQFDLTFQALYFTLTGGVYTPILASALNAGLKNSLPFFVFGNSDFATGFTKIKGQYPLNSNWAYGRPGIWGKDDFNEFAFDSNVTGLLQDGDLVVPFTSALPGAGTTTLALNIIRCNTVPYGTLLDALNSDRFVVNGVRYVLDDTSQIAQYSNQIGIYALSLFGKYKSDFISPNSYKKPEQFQNGIVDIPLKYGLDKNKAMAFFNLFSNVSSSWSIFVWATRRLTAE